MFETTVGDRFSVMRPAISQGAEAVLMERLREILEEGGSVRVSISQDPA